jgi:hypothetical protein
LRSLISLKLVVFYSRFGNADKFFLLTLPAFTKVVVYKKISV